uniref:ERCC4 domain-containing protein n=1 Tax=Theileria annulata TaxID=5874 RepID=A0A3B0N1L4_THEAN
MGVVVVFLILTKEVFKSNGLEHIKTYISGIMERFKVSNQNIKFVLVKHGTKDLFMTDQGNVQRSSNSTHKNNDHQSLISIINELETYLLIYHNVDTIETDDDGDLANIVAVSAKSLRTSYSRRNLTKFKLKNNQIAKDEPEMMKKIWLSQLLQVPNIGKDEAIELIKKYAKPYEVIESLKISEDNFYNVLKNIEIPGKKRKTLGKITSKRFLTF